MKFMLKEEQDKTKKILIIEEDKKIAAIYEKKIRNLGYEVTVWHKVTDLLKNLKKEQPDLILMNLIFNQENGWEILKTIKKAKSFSCLPVIILSQLSQKEDVKKALSCGVEAYFIKNHNSLTEVMQKILSLVKIK